MFTVTAALKLHPKSAKLIKLKSDCQAECDKEVKVMIKAAVFGNIKEDKRLTLFKNIRSKQIKLGKKIHAIPESIEASTTIDKQGKLHFPVVLVFPEFSTIELIQDWPEC